MKILSIMRHAKSSWDDPDLSDYERPLLYEGVKRTKAVADYISSKALIPDLIITSGANRAYSTGVLLQKKLNLAETQLVVQASFYHANMLTFSNAITMVNEDCKHLMLIGHNPVVTDFVNLLDTAFSMDWIKTSGVIVFKVEIDLWRDFKFRSLQMVHNIVPKNILKNRS